MPGQGPGNCSGQTAAQSPSLLRLFARSTPMKHLCVGLVVLAFLAPARAADPALPLHSTLGTVTKVDVKKTGGPLVVQPTGADGKAMGKPIELTVTGTSDF